MQLVVPIIQLVLIAVAFGLCGYLFVSLKGEMHAAEQRRKAEQSTWEQRYASLEHQIAEARKDFVSGIPQTSQTPTTGISLNKRTQALRMVKMGEGPEHIAAALSLPRKEVELLMKVQRMLVEQVQSHPDAAA